MSALTTPGAPPQTTSKLDTMYIMSNNKRSAARASQSMTSGCAVSGAMTGTMQRRSHLPLTHSTPLAMPTTKPAAVAQAEKKVAAVLDDLEQTTGSEVQKLQLEDVVASDAATGRPLVQKAVEITVQPRPNRKWAR